MDTLKTHVNVCIVIAICIILSKFAMFTNVNDRIRVVLARTLRQSVEHAVVSYTHAQPCHRYDCKTCEKDSFCKRCDGILYYESRFNKT